MRFGIAALIAGFLLDLLLGDPEWLYHPVRLIGKFISFMEKRLRARGGNLRRSAVLLTASTVLLTMACTALILWLLQLAGRIPLFIGLALMNWTGISVRCMAKEAINVRKALDRGLEPARKQVARIVGRDTQNLDEEEIVKATVETVAENTTDGVISPLLFALLGGPVLLWGYKAANTLDSMVGYMDERYRDIGWSSAKLDDLLNYIPARLTAVLMVSPEWTEKTRCASSGETTQTTAARTVPGVKQPRPEHCISGWAGPMNTSESLWKNRPSGMRTGPPRSMTSGLPFSFCT